MIEPPPHPCDLRPCTDYRSRTTIDKAVAELALARRLDPYHPSVRIHLLGSLIIQAEGARSATIPELIDRTSYTTLHVSILLGLA